MKTETHPATAFSVTTDAVIEVGENGKDAKTAPVRLVARTPEPLHHPYWVSMYGGPIVHDLAGFKIPGNRNRIALDYSHNADEVIGFANKFDTSNGPLVLSGALTPYEIGDRASEIIFKAQQGVPYEASINFSGANTVLQPVEAGETTQVNGYEFTGPGVVVREWELRSCSVCVSGADSGTSVELFSNDSKVSVNVMEADDMSGTGTTGVFLQAVNLKATEFTQTEDTEEEQPAAVEAEAVDAVAVEDSDEAEGSQETETAAVDSQDASTLSLDPAEGRRMLEAFGERGATAFVQGKTFQETLQELYFESRDENTKLKQKLAELQARLANEDDEPTAFSAPEKTTSGTSLPIRLKQ